MTDPVEARLRDALSRPAGPSSDFDLNPGVRPTAGKPLLPAAVLVPVWLRPEGPSVILTKRSSHLKHHPGQIAFPLAQYLAARNWPKALLFPGPLPRPAAAQVASAEGRGRVPRPGLFFSLFATEPCDG